MCGCVVCKMFWKSEGVGEPLYEKQTTPRSIDMQVSDRATSARIGTFRKHETFEK
jgi:hypothetical protein